MFFFYGNEGHTTDHHYVQRTEKRLAFISWYVLHGVPDPVTGCEIVRPEMIDDIHHRGRRVLHKPLHYKVDTKFCRQVKYYDVIDVGTIEDVVTLRPTPTSTAHTPLFFVNRWST